MPDAEGSLREIEYGMDVLKADGVGMFTSYGNKYLGDASFSPVLAELNRRRAVVYVHPTNPQCCSNVQPGINPSTIEYATDTTRTIASLLFSGSASRFPQIRWIWSHSGGTMPYLYARFERHAESLRDKAMDVVPNGVMHEMKRFYYETAQGNTEMQFSALLRMIPVSQVLFGSDYPYRPAMESVEGIDAYGFKAADKRAIDYGNALRLMPQLKV
jgi:predicted TIM-barrel fold metal-dependent hydrolase